MEEPIPNHHPLFDNDLSNFPEFDDVTAANFDVDIPANFDVDISFDVDFDFDFSVDDLSFADNLLLLDQQPDPLISNSTGSDDVRVCHLSDEVNLRGDSGFVSGNSSSHLLINSNDSGINLDLSRKISDQNSRDNSSTGSGSGSGSGSITKSVSISKRKKGLGHDHVAETRSNKFRRSNVNSSDENVGGGGDEEEEEKKKARMIRNRESAHLSRQRKKQYVEELEDKVKSMVSTITELNSKISYFMAENANMRQQLCGGNGMYPAYPMPGMGYPWMAYPPGYMVNPHGSKVPLVPIPRLKPQQPVVPPKVKKSSKGKTKKVASVSLLGLLFFMLLFGGLVPMINVRYGRVGDGDGLGAVQKGAVFTVDNHVGRFGHGGQSNSSNGGNASEPLVASLYVPRNDRLVRIDGNLIIQSVLVSEKALASHTAEGPKASEETGLALHGSYPPYPTPDPGSNDWRHPYLDRNQNGRQRALSSGSDFTPIGSDGKLQQWFREGLAGPMLSSGMCTEVFQFDVSPTSRSIVPATSLANITSEKRMNDTRPDKTRNRRILQGHAIPLYDHTLNTTKEHVQPREQSDALQSNKSRSSVVVSVLVDPREIGYGDSESVIGSKTLSRIFVVVLIDSVKYVTYSCTLPFMGPSSHLITT